MKKLVCMGLLGIWCAGALAADNGSVIKLKQNKRKQEYTFITDSNVYFKVTFCRKDVVRIQAAPNGDFADPKNDPEKAQIVLDHLSRATGVQLTNGNRFAVFTTPEMKLTLDKQTCRFDLKDAAGKQIWRELDTISLSPTGTVQKLSTAVDEYYYGGGEQNGSFSHKGHKIEIRTDGNWQEGGHPNPAPFYMSNHGYGVLRDTFAQGEYDFRSNNAIELMHKENRFDAYYFVGKSFNHILDLYTQFTGRPNFVPIWGLEMGDADAWMTRDSKTKALKKDENGNYIEITPDCIPRAAEKYRENDMPGGWMLVNDGYGCGYTQLVEVAQSLKALGFHTGLWTQGELVRTKWEVGTAGTRVQKLDVAWTGPAYQFSLDANKQAWSSFMKNSNARPFIWTVQGWAGTHRYAVCWTGDQSGDWNLIRYHIPTLIGAGMTAQAYATTDVDGIFGGSPETYCRDLQWKCFTTVLYGMNGWAGKMSKRPWAFEEPYKSINRKYLKLKMRLVPYTYHYCREAWDTGAPIVRGLIWNFPDDPKTWDSSTKYEYMLGDWMLVAPVYTSMKVNKGWRKEDIYLPRGRWYDYSDGRYIDGPKVIDAYPITLDKLPVFIRGGAIIPMYPAMLFNNQKPKDPLTFDIYPYGKSAFTLYEDDGSSRKYQLGEFARQKIEVSAPAGKAGDIAIDLGPLKGAFDGKLSSRVYQFRIHSELKPLAVVCDGQELLELTHPGAFTNIVEGWYYDKNERRGTIHIRLARRPVSQSVALNIGIDESGVIPPSPPYPVPKVTADLDPTEFTVTCNSQRGHTLNNAFDGTPETLWHSYYGTRPGNNATNHPYIVDIDLNGLYAVNGFEYMARQNLGNGAIKDFELYAGRSLDNLGKPVYKGSFKLVKEMQTIHFPAVWAEYVRLKILDSYHNSHFASAAEFRVLQDLNAPPLKEKVAYLSDMQPASIKGEVKMDRSIGGHKIKVNGKEYAKGIGALSGSEIVYDLGGVWDRLSGNVGMDDEVGDGGSVMFRVYGDGNLLFESPLQDGKSVKQLLELKVKGVKKLKLVLLDGGDGNKDDHGDWIDMRLIQNGSE